MHAVARCSLFIGLTFLLLALPDAGAVTAGVSPRVSAPSVADLVGEPAPDFSLPSLRPGNDSVRLSDHRGKVVYLDFWSSWCAPCRRAMPHLDALRQQLSRKDFEVVGVNVDPIAADARQFLEQVPVSYPIGADPSGRVADLFGVTMLPVLVVIDGAGVVRAATRGSAVEAGDVLRATAVKLIGEREVQ